MYAISRIEAKPCIWCWAVCLKRRGKTHYKAFYHVRRGGAKKALIDAIAWRDELLKKLKTLSLREFHQIVRSNNRSGEPGVYLIKPKGQPQGLWQAKLKRPDGRQITKSFGVRRYGKRQAFGLAVKARQRMLGSVTQRPFLHKAAARRIARMASQ